MNLNQDKPVNIDEEIDAALQLLRGVQTPAAMESRVQQSLESAAAMPRRARSGRLFWIPATCAALAAILLVVFIQTHGARQTSPVESATLVTVTPASGETAAARRPALLPTVTFRKRKPAAQPAIVRRIRRKRPQYRHVANLLSYPLTRQEKLLVRFAETAKPADLEVLNSEYQAKVEAQQDAEFAAYLKTGSGSSIKETAN